MNIKVINLVEFEAIVRAKLKHNWDRDIKQHQTCNLIGYLMTSGFPKLDVNNFGVFLKSLQESIVIDSVAVDLNDATYYYLINGTSQGLIKKSDVQPV